MKLMMHKREQHSLEWNSHTCSVNEDGDPHAGCRCGKQLAAAATHLRTHRLACGDAKVSVIA